MNNTIEEDSIGRKLINDYRRACEMDWLENHKENIMFVTKETKEAIYKELKRLDLIDEQKTI